ncbi:hypothetical protein TSAR_011110 [Trichomalopsis sarcophagae]|uniref:Uncharacterized protein n=1 Tax=Trichomalopsis sarcophagae TaxID=543379 RepID=A0A232EGF5_9HYME|nr:hypothetical protein TSAR_011110 [Trichomalopsis sarcophagae]
MFQIKKGAFMRAKRYTAIEACDAKRGCPMGRGPLMAGRMEGPGREKPRGPQLKRDRTRVRRWRAVAPVVSGGRRAALTRERDRGSSNEILSTQLRPPPRSPPSRRRREKRPCRGGRSGPSSAENSNRTTLRSQLSSSVVER